MAMNIGDPDDDESVVSAINTTPLVDVMLVLLIIFLITIPVVTHTVPVTIPHDRILPLQTKPQNISLSVTKSGQIFWGLVQVPTQQALSDRLVKAAAMVPQPTVEIRGDVHAPYKFIGEVMYACQHAGILKVGFVTDPTKPGG